MTKDHAPTRSELPAIVDVWQFALRGDSLRERSMLLWADVLPVLALRCGCSASELRIERSANGKPKVSGWSGSFSLSHDDDVGLLAIADVRRLGVDVMAQRGMQHPARLAKRVFGAAELVRWERAALDEQRRELRIRFCVIEAVVKALDWRLWPALGGVHVMANGATARVPQRRATLQVRSGDIGDHSYAIVADCPLDVRWMSK